jgi:hypothetical protein
MLWRSFAETMDARLGLRRAFKVATTEPANRTIWRLIDSAGIPSATVVLSPAMRSDYLHEYLVAYNGVHLPNDRSLGKSHESTMATDLFLAGI